MREVSPDLIAHAVIGAARAYGDCPLLACRPLKNQDRRCLAPAILGLHDATAEPEARFARILGIAPHTVTRAKRRAWRGSPFMQAAKAASLAAKRFLNPQPGRGRG